MDIDAVGKLLQTYHPSLDAKTVKDALHQDSTLAAWAAAHLTPDNLLTPPELLRYTELEQSGKVEQLTTSADVGSVQAFNDQEIKDAILELNRSTEAINKQTETLRQQQDALTKLMKNISQDVESRSTLNLKRAQVVELDRKKLMHSVANLAEGVEARVSDLEQARAGNTDGIQQTVNALLASDDKLLASLQKLGWELETEDPEEKESVAKLRDICARLIKYTVEALRTRLDRLYLETLEATSQTNSRPRVQGEDIAMVQEELESLYSEILPVAQMSVEQQYLGPALKRLAAKNSKREEKTARAVDYIQECLDYVLERVEALSSHIEDCQALQAASLQLAAIARTELAADVDSVSKRELQPTINTAVSPVKKPPAHVRARNGTASKHRRRSSGLLELADESSVEQLLRMLALSVPSEDELDSSLLSSQRARLLCTAVAERSAKLRDVAANVQESFEATTTDHLKDSSLAVQSLRDTLLAESQFGHVKLVDPEMEGSIQVLNQELNHVRSRLEQVDAEMTLTRGRRGKQDELIRRWGS